MGLGAVLALLVLILFGRTATTDAFFAAYGVYAFLNAGAQSMRVSLAARVLPNLGWSAVDRFAGGVAVLVGITAVPLLLLGGSTASLLVGSLGPEAVATARETLALLWLAGGMQLLAGLGAAALGARERFTPPAVGYVAGTVLALASVLVLEGALGLTSVAVGVLMGSVLSAGIMVVCLLGSGWRPGRPTGAVAAASEIVTASLGPLALQATYVISLAFAARIGEGAVTLYTYAFFAALLVVGVTAGPATIVLAGSLSATWDRRAESLVPTTLAVTRAALLIAAPLMGAIFLLGDDVLRLVLGGVLTDADTRLVASLALGLGGLVIAQVAGAVPLVAAFATRRYGGVAAAAGVAVVLHTVLSAGAAAAGDIRLLALAASVSSLALLGGLLVIVYRRRAAAAALVLARDVAVISALATVALGGGRALLLLAGPTFELAGVLLGAGVLLAAVRWMLPSWWAVLRRMVGRSPDV